MLTRLRAVSRRVTTPLAKGLLRLGFNADTVTLLGLVFSLPAVYLAWARHPWAALLLIGVSGLLDALDGSVARISGTASRRGAFLDSTTDRLADAVYYIALMALGVNPFAASTAMGLALTVSYTRARAGALGLREEEGVGLMERGDRILFIMLIIASYIYSHMLADYLTWLLALLSGYTVLERSIYYYRELKRIDYA